MGVTGLLPMLKSVTDMVHVSKYAGKTVGIDVSDWLYKGAYSCPVDLVLGKPTDACGTNYPPFKLLSFNLTPKRAPHLKLLQTHDIKPIVVFDGAPLPSKAHENAIRSRSRAEWHAKAMKLLQERQENQDAQAIFSACARAVHVTNDMVLSLIAVLRRMDIVFYVAPYEADAQLAFLSTHRIVDAVISQDSDCVPYGVRTVLYKLSPDGWACEIKRRSLGANEELSFVGWSEEMFLQLCVLAGCDYCPSVRGVGIMTAYKLVRDFKTPMEVGFEQMALQQLKGPAVPDDYESHFYAAILTYRHQLVFDPRDAKLKMLHPLDISNDILPLVDQGLHFLGDVELRDSVVAAIASGHVHPVTHESYRWKDAAASTLFTEEQATSHSKTSMTRSSTSSESNDILSSHLHRRHYRNSKALDELAFEETMYSAPPAVVRVQYEKPRPSSRSSWTHLDSVLGSSDHIVNFRSPKVSENFQPLAALHDPPAVRRTSGIKTYNLKEFERRPNRDHVKRVRNPTNRRRDGKGSGFEGEVLCRVDQGQVPSLIRSSKYRRDAARDNDVNSLLNEQNARLAQQKRQRITPSPSSPLSSRGSSASSGNPLIRPTLSDCGQQPCFSENSGVLNSQMPRRYDSYKSGNSIVPKPTSHYAFATFAEEKWDRILQDEIEDRHSHQRREEDPVLESSSSDIM
ncbi:hypothetical protein CCR75_001018 [Bremia lactucae]|uniref:Exonuclease 1 n=1 Tax=Bremia lactucae TaxID=4779 RepID=A0A976NYH0_BRELC|nr:hypothetical protein CCR75_001018 [Bremia lactucae]